MRHLLPQLVCLSIVAGASATYIVERDFNAAAIDGKDVPTTTDLPQPQTTEGPSSNIVNAYNLYIQNCGQSFQDAHDSAVAEYNHEFNKDPDDPNAPDFIAWAYTHFIPYQSAYRLCETHESDYKQLLATFIPETPSSTSPTKTTPTGTGANSFTSQGGGSSSTPGPKKGGAMPCLPRFSVLAMALAAALVVLMG
ncbi:hypothetical protein C8R44DRAFT_915135 [Mycena epipterygia]|nr:hypothetical protein C8R44DRAFT_915135 [Mycena epipterygia]